MIGSENSKEVPFIGSFLDIAAGARKLELPRVLSHEGYGSSNALMLPSSTRKHCESGGSTHV